MDSVRSLGVVGASSDESFGASSPAHAGASSPGSGRLDDEPGYCGRIMWGELLNEQG